MGSKIPNPEGLPTIRDGAGAGATDEPEAARRTVSALQQFLMEANTDALLDFLQRLHLKVSITTDDPAACVYHCRLSREGTLRYKGDGRGIKAALTNALAAFFLHERRDFHDVAGRP